jgi:Na+-translocating ferredoxin:NAD+ oxidoreductase RnfC subunit
MQLQEIKNNGVVGAGGAGFPAHIKLDTEAGIVLMNAAECEPLFYKDKELLFHHTELVMQGLQIAIDLTGAEQGIIGIKKKHQNIIDKIQKNLPVNCKIKTVEDFYPAGYELNLVYETTGRLIQPGELPISVGCVVLNVETLYNLALQKPVVDKYLTIGGAVKNPGTIKVPVGTPIIDILDKFEITNKNYSVVEDGLMMGEVVDNLDKGITKKTAGLIILPEDHYYIQMRSRYATKMATDKMAKAACDQCSFCTDLCPMYLVGYPVRPETAMRNRMFSIDSLDKGVNPGNTFCCECNLCTMYACPEGLDPRGAIMIEKDIIQEQNLQWEGLPRSAHPMEAFRKTPTKKLKQRLDITNYLDRGPLKEIDIQPTRVKLLLQQHIGSSASPVVKEGQHIERGERIAKAREDISANIHASISGQIEEINQEMVIITG